MKDKLYDQKYSRGFVYDKFKNEKAANEKKKSKLVKQFAVLDVNDNHEAEDVLDDDAMDSLLISLKQMVATDERALKLKLSESAKYRREIIKSDLEKYLNHCNFYFVSSKWVRS